MVRAISLFSILTLWLSIGQALSQSPRPHIIFIVADDLGWNDVSFHGSDQIPTPNIDRLASNGIILNNYYVSPICTPTRSAIMTGRHPIHTGLQHDVLMSSDPYGLPLTEKIMPQYFKQLGYTTRMIGKWHLGFFAKEYTPPYRGFDSYFGYYQGAEDYYDHTSFFRAQGYDGLDLHRNMTTVWNETGHYSTEMFAEEAMNIINDHNTAEPLLLYLPFQAVHSGSGNEEPLEAPQKYVDRFPHIENVKRKIFAAMVSALDDAVGQIYDTLSKRDMVRNSVIVFTTDNGGPANGFDMNAASNWPLRGIKHTLWEGGVRGVGFISSPLLEKTTYISDHMFHVCDWLPTLFRAAGGDPTIMTNLDGYDMWEMLSKNDTPVRNETLHNIDPISAVAALRMGEYKIVIGDQYANKWNGWYPPWQSRHDGIDGVEPMPPSDVQRMKANGRVVVNCGEKPANASTNCQPTIKPCLFHIPSDPCEYNNIADQQPSTVSLMLQRLIEYNKTAVTPLNYNIEPDPAGDPKLHGGVWVPWRP